MRLKELLNALRSVKLPDDSQVLLEIEGKNGGRFNIHSVIVSHNLIILSPTRDQNQHSLDTIFDGGWGETEDGQTETGQN